MSLVNVLLLLHIIANNTEVNVIRVFEKSRKRKWTCTCICRASHIIIIIIYWPYNRRNIIIMHRKHVFRLWRHLNHSSIYILLLWNKLFTFLCVRMCSIQCVIVCRYTYKLLLYIFIFYGCWFVNFFFKSLNWKKFSIKMMFYVRFYCQTMGQT